MIFHSYVRIPEGKLWIGLADDHLDGPTNQKNWGVHRVTCQAGVPAVQSNAGTGRSSDPTHVLPVPSAKHDEKRGWKKRIRGRNIIRSNATNASLSPGETLFHYVSLHFSTGSAHLGRTNPGLWVTYHQSHFGSAPPIPSFPSLPSDKLTSLWKIIMFNGKNHYKWPFSIAMLVDQRVTLVKPSFFQILSRFITD